MPFIVRVCKGEDSDVLRDARSLRTLIFVGEQGVPTELEFDSKDGEATHFVVYEIQSESNQTTTTTPPLAVASARVRVVRDCGVYAYPSPVAKVERVCVRKEYRRRGCGNILMQAVEKYIEKTLKLPSVVLHAQVPIKLFYIQRGYTETSEEYLEANIPHICMSKI
ncbi:actyltransferase-like protein [Trypanosoma theileri]|uniref:Actyltransferase-like protein n=1 Tax=Trypanosoma theileri TaxID=67003 RepID=A0A1X0NPT9_9TRYP|nr:actyltransferase-like protein [Trypanosoma theileri]ORC86150.1 actyltransferase-like protein [Trypanosoma theileri]